MKLTRAYKGFTIEFFMPDNIKQIFEQKGIDVQKFLSDDWQWFEVTLFEHVDEDEDGIPEQKFGKNFTIQLYGIITGYQDEKTEGFQTDIPFDEKMLISDGTINVESKFIVQYRIVRLK